MQLSIRAGLRHARGNVAVPLYVTGPPMCRRDTPLATAAAGGHHCVYSFFGRALEIWAAVPLSGHLRLLLLQCARSEEHTSELQSPA